MSEQGVREWLAVRHVCTEWDVDEDQVSDMVAYAASEVARVRECADTLIHKFAAVWEDSSHMIAQLGQQRVLLEIDREQILERLEELEAAIRALPTEAK